MEKHPQKPEQANTSNAAAVWCDNLRAHIRKCRESRPIVARDTLTAEQEWQCRVVGGTIIDWWERRYRQIVRERRFLSIKFKTAEPQLVVFTSDMPGLVAASEVFETPPSGYVFLFDDEFNEWMKSNSDREFDWHFHFWSRFSSRLEQDVLGRARAKFPAVPQEQFRLHSEGEM